MSKGGPRKGSGRPKGSVSDATIMRRRIHDHFTETEVRELIADCKAMAKKKPEIMKFLMEQLFGRAPQRIEVSGNDGGPLIVQWQTPETIKE